MSKSGSIALDEIHESSDRRLTSHVNWLTSITMVNLVYIVHTLSARETTWWLSLIFTGVSFTTMLFYRSADVMAWHRRRDLQAMGVDDPIVDGHESSKVVFAVIFVIAFVIMMISSTALVCGRALAD